MYNYFVFDLQWFIDTHKEQIDVLKYKADLYYAKGDFSKASKFYEEILEVNKRPNSSNYRDAVEALIRCLSALDKGDQAIKIAMDMVRFFSFLNNSQIILSDNYIR